jgi:hypothetical protein
MRISRWCYLMATAALVAVVIAPAAASALLTNEYNQSFAGTADCIECHGSVYDATSHGQFTRTGEAMSPAASSDMWPVGLSGKGETVTSEDVFALGAGTGLYEYIKFGAGSPAAGPFGVLTAEWDPIAPLLWEIDGTVGVEFENYACNQCHQLGAVKQGINPPVSGATTGTLNTWAIPEGADPAAFESYIPGSSIQCERCHGTGVAAAVDDGGHWNVGVKIVGYNTASMKATAKADSQKVLDSQVCGQCHGSFKSGGNIAGFTPDATITAFLPNQYTLADVPTEASYTANPGAYKFFPNGENKGLKHVYYTEWAMSGHSVRGALTSSSPNATPYQKTGASHYNAAGASRLLCNRCHTGEGYLKRKLTVDAPLGNIMSGFTEGPSNQGFLGQECATCHISHGADSNVPDAVGMSVRAPESAMGNYSTFGLSVDNKSICEDCHNWQKEITNPGQAVALPSIMGKYVSHPQREVYHGTKMLEIPAASDFMPGAKCEQCHMPATRSDFPAVTDLPRYEDRSWKRYSHRMFIMEPGDAKAWGLAPWGDSCSPCHAGETQDELQANIDLWQDTAEGLADEASSAIVAAVARGDNVSLGDIDLLKRASANLSLFVQDGSEGAHNPPYEQAGLEKAAELAVSAGGHIDLLAPVSVSSFSIFGIMGEAELGDDSPAAYVFVDLYEDGDWIGQALTDDEGNFGFAWATDADHTYTVTWARSSQSVSDVSVSVDVEVEKAPTVLSLSRSATTLTHGRSVRLYGSLDPDGASVTTVRVQYKKPGTSSWVTWRTIPTDGDGEYTTTWSTSSSTKRGTWSWRTYYAGSSSYLPDYSPTRTIRVN